MALVADCRPTNSMLKHLIEGTQLMNIYSILASKPHNPHYLRRYIKFIEQCQLKNFCYKGYTENHHICPKAKTMFPEYNDFKKHSWNKVVLTARQHFIAHIILTKVYPKSKSVNHAAWRMANNRNGIKCDGDHKVTSKIYEHIKSNLQHTEETKNKIGARSKGKTYEELYGAEKAKEMKEVKKLASSVRKHSDETKAKIGKANTGNSSWSKGISMKKETREKISKSSTGKIVQNGRKYIITDPIGVEHRIDYGIRKWWKDNIGTSLPTPWKKMSEVNIEIEIKKKANKGWKCKRIK
jgi:hypothetical protein